MECHFVEVRAVIAAPEPGVDCDDGDRDAGKTGGECCPVSVGTGRGQLVGGEIVLRKRKHRVSGCRCATCAENRSRRVLELHQKREIILSALQA